MRDKTPKSGNRVRDKTPKSGDRVRDNTSKSGDNSQKLGIGCETKPQKSGDKGERQTQTPIFNKGLKLGNCFKNACNVN